MYLDKDTFATVIQNTPLVSLDLIVINKNNKVLLGQRLNRPAKGSWFVPGGRILKNESLGTAFKRLTLEELGIQINMNGSELLGPFDHFYDDNAINDAFSTHYVAIAYVLRVKVELTRNLPLNDQHSKYKWFEVDELLKSRNVHEHTKLYFRESDNWISQK